MKKLHYTFLFLFTSICVLPQAPDIDWQKVFGGSNYERASDIILTSDSGYIIVGDSDSGISGSKTTFSNGGYDYWIMKISANGIVQWQKSFGGSNQDRYPLIIMTSDNGFLISGISDSNISGDKTENTHGFNDYWVLKLNALGDIEWENTIGAAYTDVANAILQTPDGGYLLCGSSVSNISDDKSENNIGLPFGLPYYTYYDYWIVKINSEGTIEWDNTIGSKSTDGATVALNATDGGFLIGGYSDCDISGDYSGQGFGGRDCWLVKLDPDGDIAWQKTIGGSLNDDLQNAINTPDGGYLFAMISDSPASGSKTENSKGGNDYWIVKIDASGNIIWDKTIGGNLDDEITSICIYGIDNILISGRSNSNISGDKSQNTRGGYDYWIVNTDAFGTVLWDKTIGGSADEISPSARFDPISDSIIVAGSSMSGISGDKMEPSQGFLDYWIVKLASENLSTLSFNKSDTVIYPNPTTGMLHISGNITVSEIRVYNVLGILVALQKSENVKAINLENLVSGSYIIHLIGSDGEKSTYKILVAH